MQSDVIISCTHIHRHTHADRQPADTSLSSSSSDYSGRKDGKSENSSGKVKGKKVEKTAESTEPNGKKCERFCVCVCEAHRGIDVHDHLSSGLVAFTVVCSLLFQLQHAVSGGPVLQRKLAEDFAEPVDADLSHAVGRMTEEQQERMKPGRTRIFSFPG